MMMMMTKDLFIEHLESMYKSCSLSSCGIKETWKQRKNKETKRLKEIKEKGDHYILMPCWSSFRCFIGDHLLESHWQSPFGNLTGDHPFGLWWAPFRGLKGDHLFEVLMVIAFWNLTGDCHFEVSMVITLLESHWWSQIWSLNGDHPFEVSMVITFLKSWWWSALGIPLVTILLRSQWWSPFWSHNGGHIQQVWHSGFSLQKMQYDTDWDYALRLTTYCRCPHYPRHRNRCCNRLCQWGWCHFIAAGQ